jgi:RNA polymerase sigma factor (sigma-70 family)
MIDFSRKVRHRNGNEKSEGGCMANTDAPFLDAELFRDVHARLARVAAMQGIPAAEIDDLVQETLIVAWQQRAALRSPEHVLRWLDGICRNLCLHFWRTRGRTPPLLSLAAPESIAAVEVASARETMDLADLLSQADCATVLDRALGHLPAATRDIVRLCYLAELPQREVAARLGLTLSALEARLHRARRQLADVLHGPLRAEAEALGLFLEGSLPDGWHATREWCYFCGRQRLQGTARVADDGALEVHMRCPVCSREIGSFLNIGPEIDLRGLQSFRPILKRIWRTGGAYFGPALAQGGRANCIICGQAVRMALVAPEAARWPSPIPLFVIEYCCSRCGPADGWAFVACANDPRVQAFMAAHPRWHLGPEKLAEYAGLPALCLPLLDAGSPAQLIIFADAMTAQIVHIATG